MDFSFAELMDNDVLIGIVGGSLVMSVLYLCRTVPQRIWELSKFFFTVNITITNNSTLFPWVMEWMAQTEYMQKSRRMRVVDAPPDLSDDDLFDETPKWTTVPSYGNHLFWQIDSPIDTVNVEDLPKRYTALNFLFPDNPAPVFGNDLEAVSREAADKVAQLFNMLIKRGEDRSEAQHFVLQTVVAMFAEDIDLLPKDTIYKLVDDCLHKGQNSYDLFGQLFNQMNSKTQAKAGRFKNIPYFNGGIFQKINPIELKPEELELIGGEKGVSTMDWSKVSPVIFGTIFQQSMGAEERHALGAHFTHEADILRIITPTIVRPWRERIAQASTMKKLLSLRKELMQYTVLDPACGSGNFLYLSYRELVRLEIALLIKLREKVSVKKFEELSKSLNLISPRQFYGFDRDSFGVELTKVTLMLAKKLALDEAIEVLNREQIQLPLDADDALPLDNLDDNIFCNDALLSDWPKVDTIVGNPPYQSKNKLQQELGLGYVNNLREQFPEVDGRADYCVYWFRKAHNHLEDGQRAGLVGTNTIRQNYSRLSGLDYIVDNGGTITEAVSSMKWSGDAGVDVSIVNWMKGDTDDKKRLYVQEGNDAAKGWSYRDFDSIGSSLSFDTNVTQAQTIMANAARGGCYQGQTHGHKGFLLSPEKEPKKEPENKGHTKIIVNNKNSSVLFPYLIANELIGRKDSLPQRYVVDFNSLDMLEAESSFTELFKHIEVQVLPDRQKKAKEEQRRNDEATKKNSEARINEHHGKFLNKWWQLSWPRKEMLEHIQGMSRYIVCGRVTLRPIFDFVSPQIRPNDSLVVFPYQDDYSFGILQSGIHWAWFTNRCSTLTGRYRYTSNTVFDSFPWPQKPKYQAVKEVADAAVELRSKRREIKHKYNYSYRELYKRLESPGNNPLKKAHENLDLAVRKVYGMHKSDETLDFLLKLNQKVVKMEENGKPVDGPGLPPAVNEKSVFITNDYLRMPDEK